MPATGSESRLRGLSLRLRLTLLYGLCFVLAGAALLTITYVVVAHETATGQRNFFVRGVQVSTPTLGATSGYVQGPPAGLIRAIKSRSQRQVNRVVRHANVALQAQHQSSLDALLLWSGVALGFMAIVSIGLGWLVAGRGLGPLRTMSSRARAISAENLHERLEAGGRHDELGELAGSFDGVLERLERAFEAQRRFVANASHELRTPLTVERALVEVALADPAADTTSLLQVCGRVLAAIEHQEGIIDALLALARGDAGLGRARRVDLADVADELICARAAQPGAPIITTDLASAPVLGERNLLERLVANLLDNAIVHNRAEDAGLISVRTGHGANGAVLQVVNDGPRVASEQVDELFEPFRRLDGERTLGRGGLGLGLSIVRAIANAHEAELTVLARPEGGLDFSARFPPAGPAAHPDVLAAESHDATLSEPATGVLRSTA